MGMASLKDRQSSQMHMPMHKTAKMAKMQTNTCVRYRC